MNSYLLRHIQTVCLFVIVIVTAFLYAPYLESGLVFDDQNLFTTGSIYQAAIDPLRLAPRTFPYFTLGFIQVIFQSLQANRIFSLLLHIGCAWMIFVILRALLIQRVSNLTVHKQSQSDMAMTESQRLSICITATVAAMFFALNPIAVYGAAYLAQRTIVFATLFSLLAIWCYHRAFTEQKFSCIVASALFYSAAVFSKEHAVMLPLAILAMTPLYAAERKTTLRYTLIFSALCLPAAIVCILAAKGVVGQRYEPYADMVVSQLSAQQSNWLSSASMQMGLFFNYLYYWWIPDVRHLSADIRVDVAQLLTPLWLVPRMTLFLATPIAAAYCLLKRKNLGLAGLGLFYCWVLFFTEIVTVRFQEPFVLYRSYLWSFGYLLLFIALLQSFSTRVVLILGCIIAPVFFLLASNRLQSFSSSYALWQDAVFTLPTDSKHIPGAYRIFFNAGKGNLARGELDTALANFNRCIESLPGWPDCVLAQGMVYLRLQDYATALAAFDSALSLSPSIVTLGNIQFYRSSALRLLGRKSEANEALRLSSETGNIAAKINLHRLTGITSEPLVLFDNAWPKQKRPQ
jgi:protein O-mannosyl-transferase